MQLKDALAIVLELARENVAPDDLPDIQARQLEACNLIENAILTLIPHRSK